MKLSNTTKKLTTLTLSFGVLAMGAFSISGLLAVSGSGVGFISANAATALGALSAVASGLAAYGVSATMYTSRIAVSSFWIDSVLSFIKPAVNEYQRVRANQPASVAQNLQPVELPSAVVDNELPALTSDENPQPIIFRAAAANPESTAEASRPASPAQELNETARPSLH